ncbi:MULTISPECIES: FABP family protein [Amycolatopsis]|uniref:Peroxynitrite isomerase n=1 Tax=Amycolatopsis thermalba TaxID=944492 RepID=A0ABY4NPY0_9PSEU|nr:MULTISPECIES: FABP family protein [Amycolatopsis]OXM74744.1 FABP family protein [Amycolatopsis sp. KNN50.9b]UQS21589.1 FABP family protein [Amycolatopsis thermalba]
MTSGDDAVAAAAERAESTRGRNLPQFDDLPIPVDTANLREGANLNDACLALLPLVGVWRGEGEVNYPTIEGPRRIAQQLTIAHDGRPFLYHEARSWLLDDDGNVVRAAAREVGWWRPQADDTLELLLAHNTGIIEVFYGKPRTQTSWELGTDAVVRTSTAKEVTGAQRLYGLVNNGDLGYVEERAMVGQSMQPHISLYLKRVVG